ncbi:MAG: antibiotic biosynthesis monooxygenase [Planctomycetales bacterium]|nr:antibiotic biosynthesis monooxygenase [Planctomycetales bacterium]
MIYGNIILTVKDEGDIAEIRSLLGEQRRQSLLEPGCERFEVYQSQADARVFILVERWASQQALDDHRLAKAYNEIYKPKVLPRVDRVPHLSTLVE